MNPPCNHPRSPSPVTDPLGESLHLLRLEGSLYCRADLSAPWSISVPPMPGMMSFQIITLGQCWLIVEGEEPRLLTQGSLSLIPHGVAHRFCDDLTTPSQDLFDLPVDLVSERYERLEYGGDGEATQALQGVVRFDHVAAQRLISMLPKVLIFNDWDTSDADWFQSTIGFITKEAQALEPGGETVITRLADVLVIMAIRSWLSTSTIAQSGWLGALRDPQLGPALACIHRQPEKDWTVVSLAREAGMSRSAFSLRFSNLMGESVFQYLTSWRLQLARSILREGKKSISQVISQVGYQSEASFGRAFKRLFGESPAAFRKYEIQ